MIYKYQHIKAIPAALHNAADTLGVYLPKLAELDAFLTRLVEDAKHQFIGMRVLRRGQLIFNGAYGAQIPGGEPLFEDAIYPLQSETKPILATCAAILQEDGYFDFYDQLQKYRPQFAGEMKDAVIMWQLLCHTSGIDDAEQEKYWREMLGEMPRDASGGHWINGEHSMTSTSAAGGLKSTLDDMAKFGQMWLQMGTLNGNRIISPATVRMMTRDHNAKVPPSDWFGRVFGANWGLGWDLKCDKTDDHGFLRSPKSYNHGGYGGACLLLDPEQDLVFSGYFCEVAETSQNDEFGPVFNILYSAFD